MYFRENLFIFSQGRLQGSQATSVVRVGKMFFQGAWDKSTGKGYKHNHLKAQARFAQFKCKVLSEDFFKY